MLIKLIVFIFSLGTGFCFSVLLFPKLLDLILANTKKRGLHNGPWKTHLGVGLKKLSSLERSAIARIGLGANSAKETIYWNAFNDSEGARLHSANEYKIIFDDDLPIQYKNYGFWSITVYGNDQFLVENSEKKYMERNINELKKSKFLPYSIILSRCRSKDLPITIPLPEKDEYFTISLRCYRPKEALYNIETARSLALPEIIKIR